MDTRTRAFAIDDHRIATRRGSLFARSWQPSTEHALAPIVLFHDSLGSVELWRDFPACLSERTGRRVIAYDRLGFGHSDPHPDRLALDFIAAEADDAFAAVRRALDIDRFVLFGHSVGGGMAVNCAARHAEGCVALITEAAQAFVEDRTIAGIEDARKRFAAPDQIARLAKRHGAKAQWVLDAWIKSWLAPEFAGWTLASVLPRVRCPLLVIHGADDEFGSPRHPALIGELASGTTRVEVMPDTRHVPHRDRMEAVLSIVDSFLVSVP
ncbi:MAG: alpha/beta fold hydrolase [Zoogloeaceae bacterium]|nr:alpha/beta fold hydrolase [Rhodocyclaceae bacterium]MCP5235669.1 alpha/beta fold hydrolase [Zoogloeaceae bacterium]